MQSLSSVDNNIGISVSTTADNSGLTDAQDGLSNMVDQFQSGMKKVSLATGAAGIALTAFSKGSVDYLKDVVSSSKQLATQTGMTIEQSSQLVAAMGRLGVSSDQASAAFRTFSKNIADSRDNAADNAAKVADMNNKIQAAKIQIAAYTAEITKNGDATGALHNKIDSLNIQIQGFQKNIDSSANVLDKLGVATKDATGVNKDFSSILLDVADKFKAMPDGAEKTADALALFGRSGASMIKVLNQGSQGIQDLEAQATKLGLTLNAQNIGAINDYIKSQKDLADSTNAIKIQVGTLTAPILSHFNQMLNQTIQKLVGADAPTKNLVADILAFGGPVLSATSGIAAFGSNVAGALPLLAKFGKGAGKVGAAGAVGELTGALEGGGGLIAALGPAALVIGATAVAGGLAWLAFKHFKDSSKEAADTLTQTVDPATRKYWQLASDLGVTLKGTAGQVTLVSLAQQQVANDTAMVNAATQQQKALQEKQIDVQTTLKTKSNDVATAQQNVNAVLDKFGQNSPQYDAAVQKLHDAQDNYNSVLNGTIGISLDLSIKSGQLNDANHNLQQSTNDLAGIQNYLNNMMKSGIGVVAQFGPTALAQVGGIQILQNTISGVIASWDSTKADIQINAPALANVIQGVGSNISKVQGQSDYLNNTLHAANNSAITIQGTMGNIQGGSLNPQKHASGSNNAPSGWSWVGENGPELRKLQGGEQIKDAKTSARMTGGGGTTTVTIGTLIASTAEAVDRVFSYMDQDTLNLSKGLTPNRAGAA